MNQEKIRALIVDDEPLGRTAVRNMLRRHAEVQIAGECESGAEAIAAIEAKRPDLVFLDVQMPEIDGFAVLEAIGRERMPRVVFVTAYDRYAVRAFEVHAMDYLLKPLDRERLEAAMQRAKSADKHTGEIEKLFPEAGFVTSNLNVVLALIRKISKPLPFFSRLNLMREAQRIERLGYNVSYQRIEVD